MSEASFPKSAEILRHNKKYIPGGVVSTNRAVVPEIVFARAEGAYMWDVEGNRYIDYHAGFSPHFLGHNDSYVTEQVRKVLSSQVSLFGVGTTEGEGQLAELICMHIPWVQSVQFVNSGSEATSQAIRVARAATERNHIIVMQGGYNGWHNDVACNLMTPLDEVGTRLSPGEYPFIPISAGIPNEHRALVHCVNFNDLDSVRYVCSRYAVAALITEPVLQNIGVVPPQPGYLEGLRALADEYGFVLIFDEVKTGFRHAFGGFAQVSGVTPDIVVYGKAIANGYPLAAIGGRAELMEYFVHPEPNKRVLLAGTYNAHPVSIAAGIATLERLLMNGCEVYKIVERLGSMLELGIREIVNGLTCPATLVRQGSAFCLYFMDHVPRDWHDLAVSHCFELDLKMRRKLIGEGIFFFPLATKQCSLSASHTENDVETTLEKMRGILFKIAEQYSVAST
jgi:glutamate-1-semialdehyde 2,1-aminomutase